MTAVVQQYYIAQSEERHARLKLILLSADE
jgi:hypothetical protein